MLNFKFFKRASLFFALVFFAAGYSSASAGLVKVWTDQDEKNFNQDNLAAAANAIPAKTDGEIADCFDYYRFHSVQTSFDALQESYEPGQKVYFKGRSFRCTQAADEKTIFPSRKSKGKSASQCFRNQNASFFTDMGKGRKSGVPDQINSAD